MVSVSTALAAKITTAPRIFSNRGSAREVIQRAEEGVACSAGQRNGPRCTCARVGHAVVQADVTQVSDRHVGKECEYSGERGERIADERKTQGVAMRPPRVLGQLFHDGGRQAFAGEHLKQVTFGQGRIIEGGANQLRVGVKQEAGGKASGATPGEREFFPRAACPPVS